MGIEEFSTDLLQLYYGEWSCPCVRKCLDNGGDCVYSSCVRAAWLTFGALTICQIASFRTSK